MKDSMREYDSVHDAAIDNTLRALNTIQTPQHLTHRVHARLAREPITGGSLLLGILPWATLCAVAVSLVVFTWMHPGPVAHPAGMGSLPAPPTPAEFEALQHAATPAPAPPIVHPAFVANQRDGRGAALNTQGVIATAKAQQANQEEDAAVRKPGSRHHGNVKQAENTPPATQKTSSQ